MTRVSDRSSKHSIDLAVARSKEKLENLHLRGSTFKKLLKPSDDPVANTEILTLKSIKTDSEQYKKNANLAKSQLEYTESAITDISDLMLRAKELAVQQSSSLYSGEIRAQVAEEINQIYLQSLAVANRRFGNRYIFSGHKALTKAIDQDGHYLGDDGKMSIEIGKNFYIPSNINGLELFYGKNGDQEKLFNPGLHDQKTIQEDGTIKLDKHPDRSLASYGKESEEYHQQDLRSYEQRITPEERQFPAKGRPSVFQDLKSLRNALQTNNPEIIQDLLEKLDGHMEHLVKMRTKIGAIVNTIDNSIDQTERDIINHETYRTKLEDVDVGELASDLQRQQTILSATYKTGSQLLNKSLIDFLA